MVPLNRVLKKGVVVAEEWGWGGWLLATLSTVLLAEGARKIWSRMVGVADQGVWEDEGTGEGVLRQGGGGTVGFGLEVEEAAMAEVLGWMGEGGKGY